MKGMAVSFAFLVVGLASQSSAAPPPTATTCSKNGFCYCVQQSLVGAIGRKLTEIREAIKTQTQAGMAVGYLRVPLSTVGGAFFDVNLQVAAETKERIERQYGIHDVWVLNPGAKVFALPRDAGGPDYMLMWSLALEG
jgi:hypothetical protein